VWTVLADEFKETQGGTLHFRYMLHENGGFLRVANSLGEHAQQVAETLRSPEIGRAACARFVNAFVRPQGLDPSTPILVTALENLAEGGRRQPVSVPASLYPLRAVLWAGGGIAIYKEPRRLKGLIYKQYRIAGKHVENFFKRRRKAQRTREREERDEVLRRKAG
jgi:hypothetical protein